MITLELSGIKYNFVNSFSFYLYPTRTRLPIEENYVNFAILLRTSNTILLFQFYIYVNQVEK